MKKIIALLLLLFIFNRLIQAQTTNTCVTDIDRNGVTNNFDFAVFVNDFLSTNIKDTRTDINSDTVIDFSDFSEISRAFYLTCTTQGHAPGIIQAEDFMTQGEGTSYHDTDFDNEGGSYRQTGVDIKPVSSGYAIGWGRIDEWQQYQITVSQTGHYQVEFMGGSVYAGRKIQLTVGQNSPIIIDVPQISSWEEYTAFSTQVDLVAGVQTFTVQVINEDWVDLDKITFSLSNNEASPTPLPSGTPVPADQYYYIEPSGNDATGDGTGSKPFKTIQKAVDQASQAIDKSVAILLKEGKYRETVTVQNQNRQNGKKLTIQGLQGKNKVFLLGSESSRSLTWQKTADGLSFPATAQDHIYRATISGWSGNPESAYLAMNNDFTTIQRLLQAHEPDFDVTTSWKYHENMWKAESGTKTTLTDNITDTSNSYPNAIREAGNLTNINGFTNSFLAGARIFAKDSYSGHDLGIALIINHNASTGQITFDQELLHVSGAELAGSYTKYFVEGKPQLLDNPGEWYYDPATNRIYIWTPNDQTPQNQDIEFTLRPNVIQISNVKGLDVRDVTVEFALHLYGTASGNDGSIRLSNNSDQATNNVVLDNLLLQNSGFGIRIFQNATFGNYTENITIQNSVLQNMDGAGLVMFNSPYGVDQPGGVRQIFVRNNTLANSGYRNKLATNARVHKIKQLVFENNLVTEANHNGVDFIGAYKSDMLIRNNAFVNNCLNASDCGQFKIFVGNDSAADNVLVMNNILAESKGWSYAAQQTNRWSTPQGAGFGGFGFYADFAVSGIASENALTVYKNLVVNNAYDGFHFTTSRDIYMLGNLALNNPRATMWSNSTGQGGLNSSIFNNLFINSQPNTGSWPAGIYFVQDESSWPQTKIDGNHYFIPNGNLIETQSLSYNTIANLPSIAEVQQRTPWEDTGKQLTGYLYQWPGGQTYSVSYSQLIAGTNLPNSFSNSKLQSLISELEQILSITITDNDRIGLLQ
ncbi:TPA: hypothetical protein DIV55_04190 [Patescibacteria group bacterium]|nr:hypothetical protein [Patescibacteria group bacterium]